MSDPTQAALDFTKRVFPDGLMETFLCHTQSDLDRAAETVCRRPADYGLSATALAQSWLRLSPKQRSFQVQALVIESLLRGDVRERCAEA